MAEQAYIKTLIDNYEIDKLYELIEKGVYYDDLNDIETMLEENITPDIIFGIMGKYSKWDKKEKNYFFDDFLNS